MQYNYFAKTKSGKSRRGLVEAASKQAAIKELKSKKLAVISVKEAEIKKKKYFVWGRVSLLEKMLFTKHLATMIKSGITLDESLEVIAEETRSLRFKKIIIDVLGKIRSGQELAAAFSDYRDSLDPIFISMIKTGEKSGTLEKNLQYLSKEIEKKLILKKKIRAAMIYPAIIVFCALALGFILAYFVLPKIIPLFSSYNIELPLITVWLLNFSRFIQEKGAIAAGGLFIFILIFKLAVKTKFIRPCWHKFLLAFPILGGAIKKINLYNFFRTLGILLKSGLPLVDSLQVAKQSMENFVFKKEIQKMIDGVNSGKTIFEAINNKQSRKYFPKIALSMIRVAEKSGNTEDISLYLGEYYQEEVDDLAKNLPTIIEPALLIIIGLVVAFVAAAIIFPIYRFSGSIRVR